MNKEVGNFHIVRGNNFTLLSTGNLTILPRNKVAEVMYYGTEDFAASGIASPELSAQELDLLEMADELKNPARVTRCDQYSQL